MCESGKMHLCSLNKLSNPSFWKMQQICHGSLVVPNVGCSSIALRPINILDIAGGIPGSKRFTSHNWGIANRCVYFLVSLWTSQTHSVPEYLKEIEILCNMLRSYFSLFYASSDREWTVPPVLCTFFASQMTTYRPIEKQAMLLVTHGLHEMCTSFTYIREYNASDISHTHDLTHILLHAYLVLEHDLFVGKQVKHCIVPCEAVGNSESQGVLFLFPASKLHCIV